MSWFSRKKSAVVEAPKAASTFDAPTRVVSDLSGNYTIDASHSRLGFSARHAMVTTVRGQFGGFEGAAVINAANPGASKVEITIDVNTIETGSADRDGHLKSGDFFETETFPTITFVSTKVERDDDEWTITGDLTIKGITKSVEIEFEENGSAQDPFGNTRIGFEGSTSINRKDFGLTWNAALETGGVLVSEKIKLDFDISAIKSV